MRRKFAFRVLPILMLLSLIAAAGFVSPQSAAGVYAVEDSIGQCFLLPPDAEFVKANEKEGVIYELWTPTDTELIYYGTGNDVTLNDKTRLVVKEEDKGLKFPYRNEVGNRYELKIKTTDTTFVLRYRSETDENLNHLGTETFDGKQYFQGKIDGGIPKISKNSLRTVLKENRWELAFTAEDPSSDAHYFWAQSGLKQIRVVKKVYPTPESEAVFETVKDAAGKDLITTFEGVGEGKTPLKRTDYTAAIANVRGDYYVEITDYVGNFGRYSLLYVEESSEPYFEAISKASEYVEDANLNVSIRERVSNALDAFLYVVNEKKTGDEFETAHQAFLGAMREANAAYVAGVDLIVNVENREYLSGTFDAEFSEENYGGKALLGDTLELRVTVAYFDEGSYRNAQASALSKTKNFSGVLRFNVKLLYNGKEVPFGTPVKIYLGIPNRYLDVSLVFTGSESSAAEMQAGAEWVTFTARTSGSYDLFFREEKTNLEYLWFLLLLIPVAGAIVLVGIRFNKKKSKAVEENERKEQNADFGIQEDEVRKPESDSADMISESERGGEPRSDDAESSGAAKSAEKTYAARKPKTVKNSARYPAAKKKNGTKGGKKR